MFMKRNLAALRHMLISPPKFFSTKAAIYGDTIKKLNSLQSGPHNQRTGLILDGNALHVMRQWVQQIGYQTSDFNRLNIVHVAGTKGKGTTCAFVNSILSAYQKSYGTPRRIGLYTSPHLTTVRDRIKINSMPISEDDFIRYFHDVWNALDCSQPNRPKPTYFRFLTLLSLHVFMNKAVDVAIYEVGVGGAWDSTNIFESPCAVGITHLGIDHTRSLGNSIEEIAWHKAGIMKSGCPAFTVPQDPKAMGVLESEALRRRVKLRVVNTSETLDNVHVKPNEDFQRSNASLAVELAATALKNFKLDRKADSHHLPPEFVSGLEQMVHRGRTEIVNNSGNIWFLDGAHTQESMEIACQWYAKNSSIERKHDLSQAPTTESCRILIFSHRSQRDAVALLKKLHDSVCRAHKLQFQHVIFCPSVTYSGLRYKPDLENRNNDKQDILKLTAEKGFADFWGGVDQCAYVHVLGSIQEAVELVCTYARASGQTEIFVTGSIHAVGGTISILEDGT